MTVKTKTVQDLQFELMERSSFNEFDGEQVVKDLKENDELWSGVIIDRAGYSSRYHENTEPIDLIKLRDIGDDVWNADTVYILTTGENDDRLELIASKWEADEVDWIEGEPAGAMLGSNVGHRVLRVWWD